MRTYDPADRIRYVHLTGTVASPVPPSEHRLPRGYANDSPRTRLRARNVPRGATPAPRRAC